MGIDGITITQLAQMLLGEVAVKASPNSKPDIVPADLNALFGHSKRSIMADINKVSIGKITSFNSAKQTAQIELVFMRVIGTELMRYPTLVDVPCICLQGNGGDSRVTVPITAGDTALVLFCDRDIDNWFAGADLSAPNSERLHDLSDGIAIVGLGRGLPGYNQDGPEMRGGNAKINIKGNKVIIKNSSVSYGLELAAMWACKIAMTAADIIHWNTINAFFTAQNALFLAMAADTGLNATTRAAATAASTAAIAAGAATTVNVGVKGAQGSIEVSAADNIGMIIDGSGV